VLTEAMARALTWTFEIATSHTACEIAESEHEREERGMCEKLEMKKLSWFEECGNRGYYAFEDDCFGTPRALYYPTSQF
jgi:hypothetical protein